MAQNLSIILATYFHSFKQTLRYYLKRFIFRPYLIFFAERKHSLGRLSLPILYSKKDKSSMSSFKKFDDGKLCSYICIYYDAGTVTCVLTSDFLFCMTYLCEFLTIFEGFGQYKYP